VKRLAASIVSVILTLGALASGAAAEARADGSRPISRREALRARFDVQARTDSLVVSFESDASRREVEQAVDEVDGEVVDNLSELGRVKILEVDPGTADDAIEELAMDPAVDIVEADTPRFPLAVPNDPIFPNQWFLNNERQAHPITDPFGDLQTVKGIRDADIDAVEAWDIEDGSTNPTVITVLDIGVDVDHPDIAPNMWQNPAETAPGAIPDVDDDGNGFVDDSSGWDFTGSGDPNPNDPSARPDRGHGTHVGAIAAAATDNGRGVAGVCPGCKVLHLRFGLTLTQELNAIDYLIATIEANKDLDPPVQMPVLNVSFGSPTWSQLERDAFDRLGDHGVLTVAAAGNGGLDNDMFDFADFEGDGIPDDFSPLYPASYELPEILSVAASNSKDQLGYFTGCDRRRATPRWRCIFSNWGRDSVDVAAPGTDIRSAYVGTRPQYRTWNGTSMAAPVVSGIAGLVTARHPDYSVLQLKNAIMRSTDHRSTLRRVWRTPGPAETGLFLRTKDGRVNAQRALDSPTGNSYRIHDGMIAGASRMRNVKRGVVSWPNDTNDVLSKWLRGGQNYEVVLRGNHDRRNIDLVVYKPGTLDVWQLEDGCLGGPPPCHSIKPFSGFSRDGTESIQFVASQSGRHYFLVSSYFIDDGYRLVVRRIKK
jgi:subtilisin family serine protease